MAVADLEAGANKVRAGGAVTGEDGVSPLQG